jgi:hypothetical protein
MDQNQSNYTKAIYTECIGSFVPVLRRYITQYLNRMIHSHALALPHLYNRRDYIMKWTTLSLNTQPYTRKILQERGSMYVANGHDIISQIRSLIFYDCDSVDIITATEMHNLWNGTLPTSFSNTTESYKRSRFDDANFIRDILRPSMLILIIRMRENDYFVVMKEDPNRYVICDTSIDFAGYLGADPDNRDPGLHPLEPVISVSESDLESELEPDPEESGSESGSESGAD